MDDLSFIAENLRSRPYETDGVYRLTQRIPTITIECIAHHVCVVE